MSCNNLQTLTEVINGATTVYTYTYDDDNRVTSVSVGNGTTVTSTVTYTYDAFGRTSQQVTKHGETTVLTEAATFNPGLAENSTSAQIATYNGFTYTYDANGNIASVTYGGQTTTYEYDSANQLIRENNQALNLTQTWTYDRAGNIQCRKEYAYTTAADLINITPTDTVNYTYGNSNWGDLLTAYDGVTITYDEIGNPENDGTWTYTWQHGRQLASMSDGDTTWNYTYNSDGMRTKRTNGTTAYTYVYNGSQLAQMTVGNDTLSFTYDAAGIPLTVTHNGTVCYYSTNVQGDIVAILNSSGEAVVTYSYDAWGNPGTIGGSLADTLGFLNPLRYRGYVYDQETGLYYLQSRYYDPEIGRFINADNYPTTGQGLTGNNMFAYCGNNPISRQDDGGDFWNIVIGAAVGALVSGVVSIVTQAIENKGLENINWASVGVAAVAGAVSGGLAATGIPVAGQILANGLIGAISSGVDTYGSQGDTATFGDYCVNVFTGGILGAVGGFLGGNGSGTKHLSKSAGRFIQKIGSALGDMFEQGIKQTGKAIVKAGKYYYSQIAKQAIQSGKKAIVPIIISNIPSAAYNFWEAIN